MEVIQHVEQEAATVAELVMYEESIDQTKLIAAGMTNGSGC